MVFRRASASNSSASASCGSIWIVSGLYAMPRRLDEAPREARASPRAGAAATWALKLPGGAVHLAQQSRPSSGSRARARLAAARRWPSPCRAWSAWPAGRGCARASPRRRAARASSSRRATMASIAGSRTWSRPPCTMRACARLLMSSEVQAKWMNSACRRDLGVGGEALAQPVLDRLHVVVGGGLDRLDALGVGEPRSARRGAFQLRARRGGERLAGGRTRARRRAPAARRPRPHALADQRELAEVVLQRPGLGGVTPVEGREGGEGVRTCRRAGILSPRCYHSRGAILAPVDPGSIP